MSVKRFNADVRAAIAKVKETRSFDVTSVSRGDSDGEFTATYEHPALPSPLEIRFLAEAATEYPDGNHFLVFTDTEDAPTHIVEALEELGSFSFGQNVLEMIMTGTKHLSRALAKDSGDLVVGDDGSDVVMTDADQEDDDDSYYDDDFDDGLDDDDNDPFGLSADTKAHASSVRVSAAAQLGVAICQRIKRDLRKVREAGFKIGILSGLEPESRTSLVSISIRASKLVLSDEALQAWDLENSDYVILLMRIEGAYPAFERVTQNPVSSFGLEFRFGKSTRCKPSLDQAMAAFTSASRNFEPSPSDHTSGMAHMPAEKFKKLFISSSLEQYMDESFLSLLKIRSANGTSWDQANTMLRGMTGGVMVDKHDFEETASDAPLDNSNEAARTLPPVLLVDHLTDTCERSVPLIAMEFAMRYFVRCTEFCLRCHSRLEERFEALKPYVCTDPLCLFQYMTMGLGPSIEHEILTQPYVVDLLVSFCYGAVKSPPYMNRAWHAGQSSPTSPLREYPVGLRFKVPRMIVAPDDSSLIKVQVDPGFVRVKVGDFKDIDRLAAKTWVVFHGDGPNHQHRVYHGYITNVNKQFMLLDVEHVGTSIIDPVTLSVSVTGPAAATVYGSAMAQKTAWSDTITMHMSLYEDYFDDLDDNKKSVAMSMVLDTLPSITKIRDYLIRHPHNSLRTWEEISPAAASLLEWIVASNRSCIFQVDDIADDEPKKVDKKRTRANDKPSASASDTEPSVSSDMSSVKVKCRENEKIPGMEGWVQFRFAQGSPDKELRFSRALGEVAARKKLKHPTLFAWHGSSLSNWHSILRHGLDFKVVSNGRAFGNGVYFSQDFSTSSGYSGMGGAAIAWPNAALQFSTALSLNEIINAPDEYVSSSPHLVVAQVDWIQCRYLFVQRLNDPFNGAPRSFIPQSDQSTTDSTMESKESKVSKVEVLKQDPNRTVKGPKAIALNIPLTAIPSSRVSQEQSAASSIRSKGLIDLTLDDSDEEEPGDIEFIFNEETATDAKKGSIQRSSSIETVRPCARPLTPAYTGKPLTDFQPGTLDLKSLPMLQPPTWATDYARRQLGREVKRLAETQSRTALHELGWYIDVDNLENMFQWIVELHSFDPTLPLAQDMKKAGITSIVLEVRFGRDFPYSPPFLRVVRPRFLPFLQGGGGHVTAGGSICMELLTNSGWTPANSMEAVLLQVRMAMCSQDPRPARLQTTTGLGGDYSIFEAVDAFTRAARTHGWTIPKDLQETASQASYSQLQIPGQQ